MVIMEHSKPGFKVQKTQLDSLLLRNAEKKIETFRHYMFIGYWRDIKHIYLMHM